MDFYPRDFTKMNPPTFYGSTVKEHPQEFIDEIYKIIYAMGLTKLTNSKMCSKLGKSNGGIIGLEEVDP